MRLKLIAAVLAASTILYPVQAHAGIITGIVGAITTSLTAVTAITQAGLLAAGLPTALVGAVGSAIFALPNVALAIGLNFASNALLSPASASNSAAQRSPEAVQSNFAQAEAPRFWVGGRNRLGGTVTFAEAKNGFLYKQIAHCDAEITQGLTYYLNDVDVGNISNSSFVTDSRFQYNGDSYYQIWGRLGTRTQIAQEVLVSAFAEWTSDHKGAGVADTLLTLKPVEVEARSVILNNRGVLGLGEPDITRAAWWGRYYDPRNDGSRAFGSGSERVDNPSTWGANLGNPALTIATHRIDVERFGMHPDDIDWQNIAEQADICDETTSTGESRYRCHVVFNKQEDTNIDAENAMLASCDGIRLTDEDGRFRILVGKFDPDPELVLTDADVFDIENQDPDDGESLHTHYLASFTASELDYKTTQTSPFVVPGWEEGNPIRTGEPRYYAIQNANQAFRVMRAAVLRQHERLRVAVLAGSRALKTKHRRFLRLDLSDDYLSGVYEIAPVNDPHDGLHVRLALVRCPEDRWNLDGEPEAPNFDTDVEQDGPLENIADADMSIGAATSGSSVVFRAYTAAEIPANREIKVEYRQKGTPIWFEMSVDRTTMTGVTADVVSGAVYEFQWRVSSFSQGVTDWSSIREVTATADATANAAVSSASATGGAGAATVEWTTPNETNFYFTRVYRATDSTTFGDATAIADVFGLADEATVFEQTGLSPATYSYWLETFNFSYGAGTRSGPFNAVVTA
ncbi:hypothetical protein [Oceaniradius stylonematis]|uniref:hypothetical protein n=1 Tax=Oceaniradius stylonematis TaxID=2184161 RepID=UPI003B5A83F4